MFSSRGQSTVRVDNRTARRRRLRRLHNVRQQRQSLAAVQVRGTAQRAIEPQTNVRPLRLSTTEVQASAVARHELTAASVAPPSVSTARVQVRRATRHRIRPTTSIGQRGPTVAEVFLREPGQHEVQAGSVHNLRISLLEVQKGERIEVENGA